MFLDFSPKRILIRTIIMGLIIFLATTIPNFHTIMSLFGGSTVAFTSVVFPGLFYLYIKTGEKMKRKIGFKE